MYHLPTATLAFPPTHFSIVYSRDLHDTHVTHATHPSATPPESQPNFFKLFGVINDVFKISSQDRAAASAMSQAAAGVVSSLEDVLLLQASPFEPAPRSAPMETLGYFSTYLVWYACLCVCALQLRHATDSPRVLWLGEDYAPLGAVMAASTSSVGHHPPEEFPTFSPTRLLG